MYLTNTILNFLPLHLHVHAHIHVGFTAGRGLSSISHPRPSSYNAAFEDSKRR